jgi:drug/metabolite transporter (DMT)-like permease
MRRLFAFLRANPISKGFRRLSPITRACILMVLATLLFAAMHAAIRYVAQRISGMEVAFFRNLFGLIVIVPVLAATGRGYSTPRS